MSLSSSSSAQASPSTKQKCSAEKQLYAASGPRDEIFSLGGLSYITASKACSGRTLGCQSHSPPAAVNNIASLNHQIIILFPPTAGPLFWSVSWKARETPISPCWREFLRQHSQMRVGSADLCSISC